MGIGDKERSNRTGRAYASAATSEATLDPGLVNAAHPGVLAARVSTQSVIPLTGAFKLGFRPRLAEDLAGDEICQLAEDCLCQVAWPRCSGTSGLAAIQLLIGSSGF